MNIRVFVLIWRDPLVIENSYYIALDYRDTNSNIEVVNKIRWITYSIEPIIYLSRSKYFYYYLLFIFIIQTWANINRVK